MKQSNAEVEIVFFSMWKKNEVEKILSLARDKIANELNIIPKDQFSFCWIIDYPMYEYDENQKRYLVIILFQCPKEILKS